MTRAMAEKTEEFFNREEVVAQANIEAIEEQVEKNVRREASRALADRKLDNHLTHVDAPPEEKERRKAALTKPPRRGPK